jgi:hypothetical protein
MPITISGSNGIFGMPTIIENVTFNNSTFSTFVAFNVLSQSILYNTTSSLGNWTLAITGDGVTPVNNIIGVNQSLTIVHMATQGSNAYYPALITIDSIYTPTIEWQGGVAPLYGNPNSIDVYTYNILKSASNTYTIFASQTRFA